MDEGPRVRPRTRLVLALVAVALAASLATRWMARRSEALPRPAANVADYCVKGYARARTVAESSLVDGWRLSDESGALPPELTCGALRARGALSPPSSP